MLMLAVILGVVGAFGYGMTWLVPAMMRKRIDDPRIQEKHREQMRQSIAQMENMRPMMRNMAILGGAVLLVLLGLLLAGVVAFE